MVKLCFPWINKELAAVKDPRRDHPSRKYPVEFLLWLGMLMFIVQSGSRRQYDLDKDTGAFLLNALALAGLEEAGVGKLATAETVDDLLQKLDPGQLRGLRRKMVFALIRDKRLKGCLYKGLWWRLVVDGTTIYSFSRRHCPHCLTRKSSKTGVTTYYHQVLEFKLVSPDGFAISLDSEFIVNTDGQAEAAAQLEALDPEAAEGDETFKDLAEKAKQDSEVKAFYRGAARVKEQWPKMPFLLLGDGIYANAKVMRLCRMYGWRFCLSLKDNLPTLKREAEAALAEAAPKSHRTAEGAFQELRCAEWLKHRDVTVHVLCCVETVAGADGVATSTTFLWVTNLLPSAEGLDKLANKAGRQRWKIENQGFNVQKNHGYNIEHGFGVTGHAWENYYLLAQIVHIIAQMVTMTDALHKLPSRREAKRPGKPPTLLAVFKSLRNFAKRLCEAFRYCPPTWTDVATLGKLQLRYLGKL